MARIRGTEGPDTIYGGSGRDEINGRGGNDLIYGGGGDDILTGDEGDDTIHGDGGNDILIGGSGVDHLYGGSGNDELQSGGGADFLEGGAGADIFRYQHTAESSTKANLDGVLHGVDTILDFESGIDKIQLSDIDANLLTPVGRRGGGNEAFTLVSSTDGVTPGHLTVSYDPASNVTTIYGYTDTEAGADLTIYVVGMINPAGDILF